MENAQRCLMCGYRQGEDIAPLEDGKVYDLETLNRVHYVWEMLAGSERQFDTWLHGQIMKAERQNRQKGVEGKKARVYTGFAE